MKLIRLNMKLFKCSSSLINWKLKNIFASNEKENLTLSTKSFSILFPV